MTTHVQGWSVAGKAWVGLVGSALTFVIPALVQASATMPAPWPAVIAAVVAVLTAVGVYRAPYKPVPTEDAPPPSTPWPSA